MRKTKKYIYPKLDANRDLGFIRIGGSGLANCMFVAARAWVIKHQTNREFIDPTWGKFSIGPYIRGEKDKRHYFGLFGKVGISGLRKVLVLLRYQRISFENDIIEEDNQLCEVSGLGNYYKDLLAHHELVSAYFDKIILKKHLKKIENHDFSRVIGVHIRLGDYSSDLRTDISWYQKMISILQAHLKNDYQFYVFSDGTAEELKPLTSLAKVQKVFYGNALSDIIALSKCQIIIGSDSTFSGWGAFLGQVPIVFPKRHFGRVLVNSENEIVMNNNVEMSESLSDFINNQNS